VRELNPAKTIFGAPLMGGGLCVKHSCSPFRLCFLVLGKSLSILQYIYEWSGGLMLAAASCVSWFFNGALKDVYGIFDLTSQPNSTKKKTLNQYQNH
jgi:hypothetical protein